MFVEKHSPWSPSNPKHPYDTEFIGGGDDERGSSYNYAAACRYLNQYYEMLPPLKENDAIDEPTLSKCDVLIIKIPKDRFEPEKGEVQAVVNFVERGGGLLLIGDHTNLDCSSAHMNDIARAFGFTFRNNVLYSDQPSPDQEHYQSPLSPHPAIEHVPAFDFAVSCSIDPGVSSGRPVVTAAGLWSMESDYHYLNYMHEAQHTPEMRFGSFIQAWSTHGGRGRVVAWGDSTIFSNFCLHQPGKAEVLLNLVEWLNHEGGTGVWWLWTLLGLAAIGNGLWVVRRDGSAWLVLLAAAACGWALGSTATAALVVRQMPLTAPRPQEHLPQVVIDRTTSQAPLATGYQNDDRSGAGFGLLEQAIPRLRYTTVRAEGDDVFRGDAVVMIYPSRPASEAFRRRLAKYVDGGGRLLVIDAGLNEVPSTSNQILRPFGLSLDYSQPWNGELVTPAKNAAGDRVAALHVGDAKLPPGIPVDTPGRSPAARPSPRSMQSWKKTTPKRPTSTRTGRFCAVAQYGKGLVMVVSFGNMFNDKNLGKDWARTPDPTERARYDVLFALMRRLVENEPLAVPVRSVPATEPKISIPLSHPVHRDTAPQRRRGT